MSETNNSKSLFHGSLLSGWGKMFGKKKDKAEDGAIRTSKAKKAIKSFPDNHFFSPEELLHLSKNQELCTLLQRWALEKSLWAKEKSQKKDDPKFFPSVEWQDGLLITWIDSKEIPEDLDQQADRLYQLQLEGYELNARYTRLIDARACRILVGTLFIGTRQEALKNLKDKQYYLWVKGVIDNPGEELTLSVYLYDRISHYADKEGIISYKNLKQQIDEKELAALGYEGQRKWNEEATLRDEAEQKYSDLLLLMKKENIQQGMFPVIHTLHVRIDGKDYFPKAWSLYNGQLKIDFNEKEALVTSSYLVEPEESNFFVEVLDYIHDTLNVQGINKELQTMIRVFGKPFDNEFLFSSKDKSFCTINSIKIDRITLTLSNDITVFSTWSKESIVLTKESKELLLRGVIEYADTLITDLKTALYNSSDRITRELLQDKLDNIYQKLQEYYGDGKKLSLEELWKRITSKYGVQTNEYNPIVDKPSMVKSESEPEKATIQKPVQASNIEQPIQEKFHNAQKEAISIQASQPVDLTEVEEKTDSTENSSPSEEQKQEQEPIPLPEGYIPIATPATGRWHTAEMLRQEAYRIYGKLLSAKLQKQLLNESNPWVSKQMMLPRDTEGRFFTGINAIMLALWTEERGFALPFFITESEIREKGYGILQDADSFFILQDSGASRIYNIGQTSFPITQRRAYESLKMNMETMERKKTAGYQFLDSEAFRGTSLSFDGTPGLSIYDYTNKVIHIAPKNQYKNEDDYYRDLAISMVESTRDVDFDTLRLDAYLFENLVSHLGSGIISQSCRFDATNSEYSKIWKERLETNPAYTQRILEQSALSSGKILQVSLDI